MQGGTGKKAGQAWTRTLLQLNGTCQKQPRDAMIIMNLTEFLALTAEQNFTHFKSRWRGIPIQENYGMEKF